MVRLLCLFFRFMNSLFDINCFLNILMNQTSIVALYHEHPMLLS
jgi:hypothetical protein